MYTDIELNSGLDTSLQKDISIDTDFNILFDFDLDMSFLLY